MSFDSINKEKPILFEMRKKELSEKRCLTEHLCVNVGKKPFVCEVCSKAFNVKSDLNKHVRIHTGEKPFVCETCSKTFNQRTALSRHVRIHTGEKPFVCEVCSKGFNQRSTLSRHVRIHSGEKPFICDVCSKAFNGKTALNAHILIHTGEKSFVCEVCNEAFNQKNTLNAHFCIHTGEKPFVCEASVDKKEKVYLFKVSLNKKIYREMALEGRTSLDAFAEEIVGAFDFQFDHAFGFYDNIKDIYESSEAYTSFYDFGDPVNDNEKSVKNSYIYEVFQLNKKMQFLFDYGDNWEFLVECCGIIGAEAGTRYPKVTKRQGEAPPQYPDYDDE